MEVNDLRKNICLIKSEVYVKQEIKKKKKKKDNRRRLHGSVFCNIFQGKEFCNTYISG